METHIPNTLFPYPITYIGRCERLYGFPVSLPFVLCANTQLTPFFEKVVGFKVNKLVEIGWASPEDNEFFLRKGSVSEFSSQVFVNNRNFPVTILWKSKSGRIYEMGDTDIDCSDIEFWFEGLDPLRYNQEMFPKIGLPFNLKGLTYELMVERLNNDCTIQLQLKEGIPNDLTDLYAEIDNFIGNFNDRSEKKDRKDGVVHNWKHSLIAEDTIIYEIDLGSAGVGFLKKLLLFFSKMDTFIKVKIE